jgi:2-dehydropantoate 2-reductase
MRWKYNKLLANLDNALEAILGPVPVDAQWIADQARAEGCARRDNAGDRHRRGTRGDHCDGQ